MINIFEQALGKVVKALEEEGINYMVVGGFATSYHNRARTTNDIDIVLQIYPKHIKSILKHFPDWKGFEQSFMESVKLGMLFNITDLETGMRYDFITYKDSDYNWTAFNRRKKVTFFNKEFYMCTIEDLIISKLSWYNITPSEKQLEDIKFLLLNKDLNMNYIKSWIRRLNLKNYGRLLE
ncbi:MAG: DUF6036 family nucleotidyltransferase [Chitinophagales bacterium]